MINFGIVYGLSAYGLADRLDIPQEEAAEFIERYLARFPKVKEFIETTIEQATEEGYVTTLFGRKRRIPELRSRKWQTRSLGERLAVNTPIQGTSADIIKVAMVRCREALRDAGLATTLVLQIHDELLFEAPDAEVEQARGDRGARDGERLRARPAARRRRRRRRQLAGREVSEGRRAAALDRVAGGAGRACRRRSTRARQATGTFAAATSLVHRRHDRAARDPLLVGERVRRLRRGARPLRGTTCSAASLGAVYVTSVLVTVRELGAGGVTAATIAGQLTLSLVIDRSACSGSSSADHVGRVLGVVLLAVGTS